MAMNDGDVTRLLRRLSAESGTARKQTYDELVSLVYDELRVRASRSLRHEAAGHSLQPTLLVHETYERLAGYRMAFENRAHFLNVAATAMRRLLVDRARRVRARRRGGDLVATTFSAAMAASADGLEPELLLDLDRAVDTLSPEQIRLTELRFYAGFTLQEAADVLGVTYETAKKRWRVIKARLLDQLDGGGA